MTQQKRRSFRRFFLQLISFLQNIPDAHARGNFADFLIRHRDLCIDLREIRRWNNTV